MSNFCKTCECVYIVYTVSSRIIGLDKNVFQCFFYEVIHFFLKIIGVTSPSEFRVSVVTSYQLWTGCATVQCCMQKCWHRLLMTNWIILWLLLVCSSSENLVVVVHRCCLKWGEILLTLCMFVVRADIAAILHQVCLCSIPSLKRRRSW